MKNIDVSNLTQEQKDRVMEGRCPHCEKHIEGWKPVSGSFAPEWYQTMREMGIDPRTGHTATCGHKDIRL